MNEIYLVKVNPDGTKTIGNKIELAGFSVNDDGSINEDELKKWIGENYLALTGGIVNSDINIHSDKIDLENPTTTSPVYSPVFGFTDKNDTQIAYLQIGQNSDNDRIFQLVIRPSLEDDIDYALLRLIRKKDNVMYATCPTPSEDAPNIAIQTKDSVTRDFLPKSGGTLTGPINLTLNTDASDPNATAAHQDIAFVGNSGETKFGLIRCDQAKNRRYIHLSPVDETNTPHTGIQVNWDYTINKDYCLCNDPRGLYNQDIVTYKSMVNYAPQKLTSSTTFHVNENTGSDTADLHNGRGLSEGKPFKTLLAALSFVDSNIAGMYGVNIILHSDCSCAFPQLFMNNRLLNITSDGTKRKLTLTGNVWMLQGVVKFSNLNIAMQNYFLIAKDQGFSRFVFAGVDFTGTAMKIGANGGVVDFESSCTFNGTASADGLVFVDMGGKVSLWNAASLTGSVTGKRYAAKNGSSILVQGRGVNVIPGTIAGTCDESSTYA